LTEEETAKFKAEGVLIDRNGIDHQDLQPVIDELTICDSKQRVVEFISSVSANQLSRAGNI
jgi:hypothetical protein